MIWVDFCYAKHSRFHYTYSYPTSLTKRVFKLIHRRYRFWWFNLTLIQLRKFLKQPLWERFRRALIELHEPLKNPLEIIS
jgi:hypothetical protein